MNLQQFINILLSRKWNVFLTLIMTVITTLVVSLLLPKQFIATSSIVIDQRSVDPVSGLTFPVQLLPGYMATQVDVITSHNVARKVVDRLKLNENAKMQEDFAKAKGIGDIRDWIADLLLEKNVEIKPSRESSLLQVEFTSTERQFAALAANAFSEAYIQTSIEMRAQPAKLSADWFDSQLASLRENMEHAQSILSSYEQQHGIVATDERLDIENSRLSDLSRQLVESQARTSELQSRKDLLATIVKQGGSTQSLQEVLNSSLIQSLKSDLAKAEAGFAELSKRIDINHPQYKQAKAEITNRQQQIQIEVNKVLSNITNGVTSSNQRDTLLANALAQQKAKVLELKKQHDDIAVFSRDVQNAQRAYDAAMQRSIQSRMESEMNQTNIAVLNLALPPQKHAKPKLLLNMVLSVILGGMLGMGSALVAELMDRRVRSAFDISEALAVPVFTVISPSAAKPNLMAWLFNLGRTHDTPLKQDAGL
ncbi:MAG: chain length determinant protein EpsF [Methylovulum sp.]|nr:chain length determinant protein EpsF [Methylovulum sp.]